MPVRFILSSVWVGSSMFSQLCIIQYMGLCVFCLHICLVMIERYAFFLLSSPNRKYELYPLFRVRSWNNDMRGMSLYIPLLLLKNGMHIYVLMYACVKPHYYYMMPINYGQLQMSINWQLRWKWKLIHIVALPSLPSKTCDWRVCHWLGKYSNILLITYLFQ